MRVNRAVGLLGDQEAGGCAEQGVDLPQGREDRIVQGTRLGEGPREVEQRGRPLLPEPFVARLCSYSGR